MPVAYTKMLRKNPQDKTAAGKYYPQLVTQGNSVGIDYLADIIKDFSSLSEGDISNVLENLPKALGIALASGVSVRIAEFGIFSLAAISEGKALREDCSARCIKAVKVRFRASGMTKPGQATRGATVLKFYNIDDKEKKEETFDPGTGGDIGGNDGGGIDPDA